MNSREIVRRTLCGESVPRIAVGPLAVHYCASLAGVSLRQYTSDPGVLADCVVRYYDTFRPDAVWLSADTWVNAQAMGAAVAFPGDDQPLGGTGEPLIRQPADIDRIPRADPGTQGRWPLMLEALERIRRGVGPDVFVVACFDQYPFSLACAVLGIERAMRLLLQDRAFLEALMERCLEYTVAYARALAEAGADLLSGGDSPAGLVSPAAYREVVLPFETRVIEELRQSSSLPVSLHICGDTRHILSDMSCAGADVVEIDHRVDVTAARSLLCADGTLWGNLDTQLLAEGTPGQVQCAAHELLHRLPADQPPRLILSSGCTLAPGTPPENLHALLRAAQEHGPFGSLSGSDTPSARRT